MSFPEQIGREMSLRDPQTEALRVLDDISAAIDFKGAALATVAISAGDKSRDAKPVEFDTTFPSLCFAVATGVGKTRLMGASMYYLWKKKGYRHFFILAPNITIYDKLRSELTAAHPKYMFVGLSDFPAPEVFDGESYQRFRPGQILAGNPATVFVFNIGKIFAPRTDTEFKFHRFNEFLGDSFSAILKSMDDLVVMMDESHRYRGPASLEAINHLRPVLGLEFTATPKYRKNVVYSFSLAQAIGRYVKTPTVVTRTNLTISDAQELEKLKLVDGMARHERKKGRLQEYCEANNLPLVKPFVLISTKDTAHATQVRHLLESEGFLNGQYKDKVIEIHSGTTGAESDENIQRLLSVEHPTSTVEVVIHVNMLKEGWDVKNLYTIIPLRASISEILTEQTIGRGLRLPFAQPTGDSDLDALEVISHDQYAKLIEAAKGSPLFRFKELTDDEFRPVKTVPVTHDYVRLDKVLDRLTERKDILITAELAEPKKLSAVVNSLVAEAVTAHEARQSQDVVSSGLVPGQLGLSLSLDEEPSKPFDPKTLKAELEELLGRYANANIDVPHIVTETTSKLRLEPFEAAVNTGPFELVEQRMLSRELASGKEHMGEQREVMEIDNPRAFLAGKLLDAVDELDATSDKTLALSLVDSYIKKMSLPDGELKKIIHLYRDSIIKDLRTQLVEHIHDETKVTSSVRAGFIKFRPYSKTVLQKEGIVPHSRQVPRGDVHRYLFEGFRKSFYPQVPFDSTPEKDFAAVLERDDVVLKWVRPPEGNIPLTCRGSNYTPDFIIETATTKYMVEVKARKDLTPKMDHAVREKALAGIRWCETASQIKNAKQWEYKIIPEDAIAPQHELKFVFGQAVKLP